MALSGKKVVVLVEDSYQELEVWYPYYCLRQLGAKTVLAGPEKREYRSKYGYPAQAELPVKQLSPKDWDCVVIPGGYAPDRLRRHSEVNQFVKKMFEAGKVVAAICHGPWVAISAGILRGRKCTCYYAIKDDVINAGAKYSDAEVVVDGKLISSRNPGDLPAFCREIAKALNKKQFA